MTPWIIAALLVFVLFKAYAVLSHILISFLLIMLIALAVNPVVIRLRNFFGGRRLATATVVACFLVVLGLAGYAFYRPVKKSVATFVERLPQYWERIQKPLVKMEQKAVISEEKIKKEVKNEIEKDEKLEPTGPADPPPPQAAPEAPAAAATPKEPQGNLIKNSMTQWAGGLTSGFLKIASNAASMIFIGVTVFVGVVFTLLDPKPVLGMIFGMIPQQHHPKSLKIARRIIEFIPHWASATFLGMAIIGGMVFLAMWPIFGFQDALVLGLIAMVFEAVPYLGPILSVVPALLLAIGEGGWTPALVLATYGVVQLLENNVIYPMIVGSRLSLHPLAVLFSILLCVAAFGVLGVILAIPIAAIIRIFHEELYRTRFLPDVEEKDLEKLAARALRGD